MKLQIDTIAKKISIEGSPKMSDVFDALQKFFPDGEWEEYCLETSTVIHNWGSPIIYERPYLYPPYTITCETNTDLITTATGATAQMVIDASATLANAVTTSGYCVPVQTVFNIESN